VAAQEFAVPLIERRIVDAHRTARHRPDADQGSNQRGLAASAGADDTQCLAAFEPEAEVGEQRLWRSGDGDRKIFNFKASARRRQDSATGLGADQRQGFRQAANADTRSQEGAPIGDRGLVGASARPIVIEAAIMEPLERSCWIGGPGIH